MQVSTVKNLRSRLGDLKIFIPAKFWSWRSVQKPINEILHATHKCWSYINSKGNVYFHVHFFFKMLSKCKLTGLPQNTFNCVFNSTVQESSYGLLKNRHFSFIPTSSALYSLWIRHLRQDDWKDDVVWLPVRMATIVFGTISY